VDDSVPGSPASLSGSEPARASTLELALEARSRDLGGFAVRRVLPSLNRRMVGPFIFYDHFGPLAFPPGAGFDVRPHPHIGLATITYLFDGEILHRDSLGSVREIRPGDVNWMIAGRGIAHSERTRPELRASGSRLHGLQSWVALPKAEEEHEPSFTHHPSDALPVVELDGATLRVIAGTAYGASAPALVLSPTLYVHAALEAGVTLPVDGAHPERAAYVVSGAVELDGVRYSVGQLLLFRRQSQVAIRALEPSHVMLLGGAPLDGERHIEWNFVSSSLERIERAKDDWRNQRFGTIPGDDREFIPLP
jgi:redox-sensitive bicupin YhaK (pirin superfamily)